MSVNEKIANVLFKKRIKNVGKKLEYADIKTSPQLFLSSNLLIVLSVAAALGFFLYLTFNIYYSLIAVALFVFLYYIFLTNIVSLLAYRRARFVESSLADVLKLISSNLKSGINMEEALVLSARPEFGFFSEKIKGVGKLLATGTDMKDAINTLSIGIDSDILRKTIKIIIEGLESGGEITILLESIADNIQETESLRKEVNSTIFVYALFIFIAACLIAPILYAVSIQLAGVLSRLSESIAVQFMTREVTAPVTILPATISEEFLINFAYINLIITSAFASLIIALINKGNEKYGIKYIPFLMGIALSLFYIATRVLTAFFGGIRVI